MPRLSTGTLRASCQHILLGSKRQASLFPSTPAIKSPTVANVAVIGAGFAGIAVVHELLVRTP
jgi:NADH dehydrogenase FAD-containing subunit